MLSAKLLFLPTYFFTDFNRKKFEIPQKVIFWTERIILYAEKVILYAEKVIL